MTKELKTTDPWRGLTVDQLMSVRHLKGFTVQQKQIVKILLERAYDIGYKENE